MIPLLLAMQAAGMITDYMSTQRQIAYGQQGYNLEQQGINTNIELLKANAADESVQSMKQLRANLGTQIAMQAARGTATNAGSAVSLFNTSIANYNEDKQARRMNLLANEAQLRAGGVLSGLHQLTSETELGQAMGKRFFNDLPLSSAFSKFMSPSSSDKSSYGLTSV